MGLFDTIYVSESVSSNCEIACSCGSRLEEYQTKDFAAQMRDYILDYRNVVGGKVTLYRLGEPGARFRKGGKRQPQRPADETFWFGRDDSEWVDGAWSIANREREIPDGRRAHQWAAVYGRCKCGLWVEFDLQFTNGELTGVVRREESKHLPIDLLPETA